MASRISTSQVSLYSLETMLKNQKELSRTQLQISTGRRILAPADDPYGSARLMNLKETVAINEQYQVNAGHAKNRLNLEEGVLEGVSNAIQRIRELAIQANNDSQTRESRNFIAQEIEKLYDQILDLANTTDANGEYLFAGYKGKTRPFAPDINGNVQYYGDDGQRVLKIGTATSVEVSDPHRPGLGDRHLLPRRLHHQVHPAVRPHRPQRPAGILRPERQRRGDRRRLPCTRTRPPSWRRSPAAPTAACRTRNSSPSPASTNTASRRTSSAPRTPRPPPGTASPSARRPTRARGAGAGGGAPQHGGQAARHQRELQPADETERLGDRAPRR